MWLFGWHKTLCDVIYINHSVSDGPVCLERPTKINVRTGKVVKVSIGTRREWIKNQETVMRNYSKLIRRSPIGFSGSGIFIIWSSGFGIESIHARQDVKNNHWDSGLKLFTRGRMSKITLGIRDWNCTRETGCLKQPSRFGIESMHAWQDIKNNRRDSGLRENLGRWRDWRSLWGTLE